VADETAAFGRLDTRLADTLADMTLGAIIHLHTVPGVLFESADVFAPNIAAV
jgi:hypothetical protein